MFKVGDMIRIKTGLKNIERELERLGKPNPGIVDEMVELEDCEDEIAEKYIGLGGSIYYHTIRAGWGIAWVDDFFEPLDNENEIEVSSEEELLKMFK